MEAPEEPKKVRKRPDRTLRLQQRKGMTQSVVKACLLKHLASSDAEKRLELRQAIRGRVEAFSKRYRAASLGMLHLVREVLQDGSAQQLPNIFQQTFFRQLMLGTEEAKKVAPEVKDLHARRPWLLENTPRFLGDSNIYSAGAKKYITNLKNHLRINLLRVVKKLVYRAEKLLDTEQLSNDGKRLLLYKVTGWPLPSSLNSEAGPLGGEALQWAQEQRGALQLPDGVALDQEWLRKDENLPRMLRFFAFANRQLQAIRAKEFVMVPVAAVRMHHIAIDNSVLFGILKEVGDVQGSDEAFASLADAHWSSTFRVSALMGGEPREFTRLVETDGVDLCMHQMRPKTPTELFEAQQASTKRGKRQTASEPVQLQEGDRVIGLDPGKRTIFHCAELLKNGKYRSMEFSSARYQRESGMLQARRRAERWNAEVWRELQALATVSLKGAELSKLLEYMEVYSEHKDVLWSHYSKDRWARQRMRLYGGKKRSFAGFLNELAHDPDFPESPRRVVVAYGNAGFDSGGMKGKLAVPRVRAYRECASRFLTVPVDEFRTSRVHWETENVMGVVGSKADRKAVRGLLWCGSTNQTAGKFVNRDLNAAINIRKCLVLPQRPPALCRHDSLSKLSKSITKWIRC
jgi:hypothetical protein